VPWLKAAAWLIAMGLLLAVLPRLVNLYESGCLVRDQDEAFLAATANSFKLEHLVERLDAGLLGTDLELSQLRW
jgi:hypothetical protein